MAFFQRSAASSRSGSTKSHRPQGVSRRQRKRQLSNRQLGFETLEDRRVMSADSPLAALQGNVADDIQIQVQSYSSATEAGQTQILLNELYWQSLVENTVQQFALTSRSIPTDPLSGNQWFLINTGQEVGSPDFQDIFATPGEDINVAPVWLEGLTGAGVTVAVIDSGVQVDHPDLAANISPTLQLNAITGANDGNPFTLNDPHGTAVAGLIGAADNGIGGTGVAPGVTLVPINLIGGPFTAQSVIDAFRFATDEIDITNNSWGPSDLVRSLDGPSAGELLALRDSVIFGRPDPVTGEGLGVIHVWAAGNGASANFDEGFPNGVYDTAAYDGYVASRYTIGVTGVDHDGFFNNIDGTFTDYPEVSTAVFVAAPTGSVFYDIGDDTGLGSGIWTTDTTGEFGFNFSPDPVTGQEFDRDFLPDTDYTSRFNGTSASAPIVSGVIALMLEANPSLSWRDVQEILVRSARQNAKFGIPSTVGLGATQNTWIINQMPVFHDPDAFDPLIDPVLQTLFPTLDITLGGGGNAIHYQPTPQVLTNGAGYTVSQGVGPGGQNIGYAQGVIDAELAVQLAQQWQTKNQALPDELTFTTSVVPTEGPDFNIPAAERGNDASGNQLVPGGILGSIPGGFIDYWNEYFEDIPFDDPDQEFEGRGGFLEFSVPANNTMTVESVEVKLSISGANAQFLDRARVLLISPDGTYSELNQFWVDADPLNPVTLQNASPATIIGEPGSVDPDTGNLVWTFTTNRNWGERSDDAIIFDPTTMEPASGIPLTQGWQLHIENYDQNDSFGLAGLEIVWHGSPIGANTERVQGLIGVDDNRNDLFNFSRVFLNNTDTDGVLRFGEVTNTIDITHESMGANITVEARRASDGVLVDQFVTGADGNYYFDLVPDDYIISIVDPLGRTALDDSFTDASLFLQDYKTEWTISADFFKVWDYNADLEVEVQADGTPIAFLDGGGNEIVDGIKNLNFLLDPGPVVAPQVDFTGVVFADINGDGIFNTGDVNVPGVSVFGDVNRNGQFDAGEIIVATNINGEYSLTIPLNASLNSTVVNVGVIAPPSWTLSDPSEGFRPFFVSLGDSVSTGTDFAITPPVGEGPSNGTSQDGYLLGVVFIDASGDGIQQVIEAGQAGVDVFIDSNGSGSFEAGERITSTNANGAFIFEGVALGTQVVRIETEGTPFIQTFPLSDGPQVVNLAGGGTVSNILFGLFGENGGGTTTATLDFGDLPASYGITLFAEDGARHAAGVYFLGAEVDAELNGLPSPDALGDDNDNFSDEDGIVVDDLVAGATGRLVATASLFGGFLQGWVDFNGNGNFDDVGERIITDGLLVPGANEVSFEIPATLTAGDIFARFRYGEFGIDSVTGAAVIGEVEDYKLDKVAPAIAVQHGPDFDEDGRVDGFDFLLWQRGYGASGAAVTASDGDSNSDNIVDGADLIDWSAEFGGGVIAASAPVTGDYDGDGDTDGSDFLTWQTGFGTLSASLALGDGNNSNSVDAADLSIWSNNFGQNSGGAPLAATAGGSGESDSNSLPPAAQAEILSPNVIASRSATAFAPTALSSVEVVTIAPRSAVPTSAASLAGENNQNGARQAALAFLARGPQAAEELEPMRLDRRHVFARFETLLSEVRVDRSDDVEELGRELQGRVLDRLFARRQRPLDGPWEQPRSDQPHSDDEVSEEALTVALGEEIDWRFF